MVDDGGPVGLDGVQVAFDDERVVSDAGIMLAATLAERLGVEDLVDDWVRLGVRGAASRAGRKVMTLIYAMALGADSIDDCQVLRAGRTGRLLGGWMPHHRRWAHSCARLPSVTSANWTACSPKHSSAHGRPVPARAQTV
jgi:hypothetical protein